MNRRNAMCYPGTPFFPETTSSHHVQNEILVDMVKSLYNIQHAK